MQYQPNERKAYPLMTFPSFKIATNNSIGCFIAQVDKFHPSILWTLFSGNDYDKYQV